MAKKIIFIVLILIGVFLRLYRINSFPAGLFMDEATIAVDAKSIAQNGIDEYGRHFPFTFEALTDNRLPGYVYLTALSFKIFGPELITIRLIALISSILSIFLIGYFARTLFPYKKNIAYFAMVIMALSPFHIHFSRIGYETMLATTFLLLYFIALVKIIKKERKTMWHVLGAISIIISCWTYPGPSFIIPAVTLFIMIVTLTIKLPSVSKKNIVYTCTFFLIVSFLTFIPSFFDPLISKRPVSYITNGTNGTIIDIIHLKTFPVIAALIRIWNFEFLFDKGDIFAYRSGTKEIGIFLSIFSIPFVIGIFYFIKEFTIKNFSYLFLLILLAILGMPSALTSTAPYGTRFLPMLIPFCILIALGTDRLIQYFNFRKRRYIKVALYFTTAIILFYQITLFAHIYFSHFTFTSLPEFPKAQTEMGKYVKNQIAKNPNTKIYFLEDKTCRLWSHDDLQLWYFADLDSKKMSVWNNTFRTKRYAYKGSPFDAYDNIIIPSYTLNNLILFPGYSKEAQAPFGSMYIRCGGHLPHIDFKKEKIIKVIYMYEDEKRDPYYVITEKR